jgi:hypothetical protein
MELIHAARLLTAWWHEACPVCCVRSNSHEEDAMATKHAGDKSQDKSQKDKDKSGTAQPSPNKPQHADKR